MVYRQESLAEHFLKVLLGLLFGGMSLWVHYGSDSLVDRWTMSFAAFVVTVLVVGVLLFVGEE